LTTHTRIGIALGVAVACFALAVVAVIATGAIWERPVESALRAVACGIAAALLGWAGRSNGAGSVRSSRLALVAAASIGAAAFLNFGALRHFNDTQFLNYWEQFHYQLGSKYFPELGYDGLYVASLAAEREVYPERPTQPIVRDLRTNRLAPTDSLLPHVTDVRARFDDVRWREFVVDHRHYLDATAPGYVAGIRRDHGYNPPPSWTAVARIFSAHLPSGRGTIALLAALDWILMGIAFAAVFRTFGLRAGCAAVAVFGLAHGWRYLYVGAFLRLDWLAAVMIGICQLERRRFGWAGASFGYAASVRLFPALLLFGPAIHAARAWLRGERPRWPLQLAAGFGLAVALMAVVGGLSGRGIGAWMEFTQDIQTHAGTWAPTKVGLAGVVANGTVWVDREDGASLLRGPWPNPPRRIESWNREHRLARAALAIALLTVLAVAAWRAPLSHATGLGIAAVFVAIPLGSYYWVMLLVLPLCGGRATAIALLAVSAGVYATACFDPPVALLHAMMSVGIAVVLLGPPLAAVARRRIPPPTRGAA